MEVTGSNPVAPTIFCKGLPGIRRRSGFDSHQLAAQLCQHPAEVDCEGIADDLKVQLLQGGFLTHDLRDQLDEIRVRYRDARLNYPLILTLTTTMDCNLGCYVA